MYTGIGTTGGGALCTLHAPVSVLCQLRHFILEMLKTFLVVQFNERSFISLILQTSLQVYKIYVFYSLNNSLNNSLKLLHISAV